MHYVAPVHRMKSYKPPKPEKMNAETLHAIDALYLDNFLQTLLYRTLHAEGELRECLRQADVLSETEALSSDCRSRYAEITKRLSPLVTELDEIIGDLYTGGKLASDCEPLIQWGLVETVPECETRSVLERLDLAERELIAALNRVGERLLSTPVANISWGSQARIRAYLKLKPIPERPCYQAESMLRFCASPPYLSAHYFAQLPEKANAAPPNSPWLLDSDFDLLTLLPLFEDIEIELEVCGCQPSNPIIAPIM